MKNLSKSMTLKFIFLVAIIYFVFAISPDILKWAPLPTGGWDDWLSFIGVLFGVYFGFQQLSITLQNESYKSRKDKQYSVLPYIDVKFYKYSYNCTNDKNANHIFWHLNDRKGYIVSSFIDTRYNDHIHSSVMPTMVIELSNKGLGNAFSIKTFLHMIKSDVDDIFFDEIVNNPSFGINEHNNKRNFVHISANGNLTSDEWQIFPVYSLLNNSLDKMKIMIDSRGLSNSYGLVIEFRYCDIYDNLCSQYLFMGFHEGKTVLRPVSKVYFET